MHLVGFITRIRHVARSPELQIKWACYYKKKIFAWSVIYLILGAFAKLRKGANSFVLCVGLNV